MIPFVLMAYCMIPFVLMTYCMIPFLLTMCCMICFLLTTCCMIRFLLTTCCMIRFLLTTCCMICFLLTTSCMIRFLHTTCCMMCLYSPHAVWYRSAVPRRPPEHVWRLAVSACPVYTLGDHWRGSETQHQSNITQKSPQGGIVQWQHNIRQIPLVAIPRICYKTHHAPWP